MAKDETLIGQAGNFEAEGFVDKGDIWRIVLGGYGAGTIYVNGEPVTHTADDYKVPTFVETVEVPEIEEEPSEPSEPTPVPPAGDNTMLGVLVALMAVSALAIVTLKKKEF